MKIYVRKINTSRALSKAIDSDEHILLKIRLPSTISALGHVCAGRRALIFHYLYRLANILIKFSERLYNFLFIRNVNFNLANAAIV